MAEDFPRRLRRSVQECGNRARLRLLPILDGDKSLNEFSALRNRIRIALPVVHFISMNACGISGILDSIRYPNDIAQIRAISQPKASLTG
jgi:hypothetical protein